VAGKGPIWVVVLVVPHRGAGPLDSGTGRVVLRQRMNTERMAVAAKLELFWACVEL
jgi:hypothetical protein